MADFKCSQLFIGDRIDKIIDGEILNLKMN